MAGSHTASDGFPNSQMREFPTIVNVEVFRGECPCRCVHCPVGSTHPAWRPERFGKKGICLSLYRKVLQEIAAHPASSVRIHSVGEPLLWPDLPAALRLTSDAGVRSWIFTSAVTTNTSLLELIAETVDVVEVSVNSTCRADYLTSKGIDAFNLVERNIEHLHDHIEGTRLPTRLIVSRVQSTNPDADTAFVRYWKATGLVSDAFVRTYHNYNDLLPYRPGDEMPSHKPCLVHWARFNISVDGHAVVCFNELFKEQVDPSLLLGNVSHQTISGIWHSEALTAVRQAELTGDYSALPCGERIPCKDCRSCQPLGGNRLTSEHQLEQIPERPSCRHS